MALEDFDRLIHDPLPGVLALGAGILLGLGVGFLATGRDESTTVARATMTQVATLPPVKGGGTGTGQTQPTTTTQPAASSAEQQRWQAVLERGVADAQRFGGSAEAAVWLDGWPAPVMVGGDRRMRMWSLSKPATAIAVRELVPQPGPALSAAMEGAITRSENCRQRRVVLGLQQRAGGEAGAAQAFEKVFADAGANGVEVSQSAAPPDASCVAYLKENGAGIANPLGPALQLGVSTWTVRDGVTFMRALADNRYGEPGQQVVKLMSIPKDLSREGSPSDFTAEKSWGAGNAFRGFRLAYKAGWGGTAQQRFVAAQAGIVQSGARTAAVMAAFHPSAQPPSDDPGKSNAPQALEAIFEAMAGKLRSSGR